MRPHPICCEVFKLTRSDPKRGYWRCPYCKTIFQVKKLIAGGHSQIVYKKLDSEG